MNYENFTHEQQQRQINDAHADAIRANKIGKSLVGKTVRMVEMGESAKPLGLSPRYAIERFLRDVDFDSSTLALNAELRTKGIDVEASLKEKWDGSIGDPGYKGFIEIKKIDGEDIESEGTPGWRELS